MPLQVAVIWSSSQIIKMCNSDDDPHFRASAIIHRGSFSFWLDPAEPCLGVRLHKSGVGCQMPLGTLTAAIARYKNSAGVRARAGNRMFADRIVNRPTCRFSKPGVSVSRETVSPADCAARRHRPAYRASPKPVVTKHRKARVNSSALLDHPSPEAGSAKRS